MSDELYRVFVDDGGRGTLPGVPRRNLTRSEYDAMPGWLQASVDNSTLYRKAPSAPAPAKRQEEESEE